MLIRRAYSHKHKYQVDLHRVSACQFRITEYIDDGPVFTACGISSLVDAIQYFDKVITKARQHSNIHYHEKPIIEKE
jgi:hypothetical protein